jgi:hypothetical protein
MAMATASTAVNSVVSRATEGIDHDSRLLS